MGIAPYGYHLDANQLARFLRKKAIAAGVEHIEAMVTEVNTDNERIISVDTDKGNFKSDYFIDCTGFKGLLINAVSDDNWVSFEHELPCNKAVAVQRKHPAGRVPNPYTEATALSNGWVWQIDLVNRQGTGYVYDGNRLTKEQAESELKAYLGDESEFIKTLHIDMQIGRRKRFWVGNCITVGLAGGFIEPLESTGLHLINLGARLLSTHLTQVNVPAVIQDSYSDLMINAYEDLKQFIVLHYCITDRDDTEFWQQAQKSVEYCPELEKKLAIWKHKICEYADLQTASTSCFNDENYRFILYGMNYYPELHFTSDKKQMDALFEQVDKRCEQAIQYSETHQASLAKLAN
jgi:tryptophan halogenase